MRARAVCFFLAVSLPALAEESAPAPRRFVYRVEGDVAGCPAVDDVRGRILAHLGYDPFLSDLPGAKTDLPSEQIFLSIARSPVGLGARIERTVGDQPRGKRDLLAATGDCAELVSSAAFAIAFALDPLRARELPAQLVPTPPPVVVTPAPQPLPTFAAPVPAETKPAPIPSPPWRLRLGASLFGAMGTAPAVAPSASALVGVSRGRWSVDAEGRGDIGGVRDLGAGESLRASVLAGSLVPCVAHLVFRGCVVGSLGVLRSASAGLDRSVQADNLWAAVGLRVGAEVPLSAWMAVRPFGEVQASLHRTSLLVDAQPVWTSPPLVAALGIGVVVGP